MRAAALMNSMIYGGDQCSSLDQMLHSGCVRHLRGLQRGHGQTQRLELLTLPELHAFQPREHKATFTGPGRAAFKAPHASWLVLKH